jgi:hypothetical protein
MSGLTKPVRDDRYELDQCVMGSPAEIFRVARQNA